MRIALSRSVLRKFILRAAIWPGTCCHSLEECGCRPVRDSWFGRFTARNTRDEDHFMLSLSSSCVFFCGELPKPCHSCSSSWTVPSVRSRITLCPISKFYNHQTGCTSTKCAPAAWAGWQQCYLLSHPPTTNHFLRNLGSSWVEHRIHSWQISSTQARKVVEGSWKGKLSSTRHFSLSRVVAAWLW